MRVLIVFMAAFILTGCDVPTESTDEPVTITKAFGIPVEYQADILTILDATKGKHNSKSLSIVSNLCAQGKIGHKVHEKWRAAHIEVEERKLEEENQVIQEFRQNITNLQNRVFELERKE